MTVSTHTLLDVLLERAGHSGTQCAYTFLHDGDSRSSVIAYGQLDRQARAIAARLQSQRVFGHRALLTFPPGLEFVAAFWGCLYAGVIAVPVPVMRMHRSLQRFESILADSGADIVLTTSETLSRLEPAIQTHPSLEGLQWIATDHIDEEMANDWTAPILSGDTLAFLQYTSGSTAMPKGVMVSHRNLLHNLSAIQRAFRHTSQSIGVSWLPFHHDMGLIGGLLQPLYAGFPCYLMSPTSFVKNPLRWLQMISRYRATTSGGPNFAYEACIRAITPAVMETLDLCTWGVAFTGAEPIHADTLTRFSEVFGPVRFAPEAFLPCYGLAEATLMVTAKRSASPTVRVVLESALHQNQAVNVPYDHPEGKRLVSSGQPFCDMDVAIVNPHTHRRCAETEVGEIWISGGSVAKGYWNKLEESGRAFHAFIQDTGEGPYLRSGDLGFVDNEELYVTGRVKDLLIIKGRNHYPQDIEWTVNHCDPLLLSYTCAAFSVEMCGEERLILVQEVSLRKLPDLERLIGIIRLAIAKEHEIEVYGITFVKAGSLPKTTSGKTERHTCKAMYGAKTLKVIGGWHALSGSRATPRYREPMLTVNAST